MVNMASILMASRFMEKTPFTLIVEYEAAGVNIAKQKNLRSPFFSLGPAL